MSWAGATLLPRRGSPSLVGVLVLVRDVRLRFAPLDVLVLLDIELERVGVDRTGGRVGDDVGLAIEAFEVASKFADDDLHFAYHRRLPPFLGTPAPGFPSDLFRSPPSPRPTRGVTRSGVCTPADSAHHVRRPQRRPRPHPSLYVH
jgi:hypothetical protein